MINENIFIVVCFILICKKQKVVFYPTNLFVISVACVIVECLHL